MIRFTKKIIEDNKVLAENIRKSIGLILQEENNKSQLSKSDKNKKV